MAEGWTTSDDGETSRAARNPRACSEPAPLPAAAADEAGLSPEARLYVLREMMDEAFFTLDAHGCIRELNTHAAALLGQPAERLLGREPWRAWPELAGTVLHERLMAALTLREGGRFLAELPSRLWLEVKVRAVGDETWVLAADITQRQHAEHAVSRTEERFRQLGERFQVALDSAQMAVWETNLATGQVFRSEGHDRLYGYAQPLEEWTHERFLASIHPEDRPGVEAQVAAIFSGEVDSYASTFRVHWPDGSWHWLISRAKVLRDAAGNVVVVRGAILDVTALKETEAALQQAVRTRDDFLSLASHELRTPLTSLRLQLQLLRRMAETGAGEPLGSPKVVAKLDTTERQLRRLGALVDNLLDVSRIQRGKLDFQYADGDLAAVVSELVARFTDEARQAGVVLSARVDGPVPGRFDLLRMEQVVSNLLSNALRYGAGSPVRVSLTRHGGLTRLRVADSGPGVPEKEREHIFERFSQGHNAPHKGGLGLGLYIVRQIVEAHGGHIRVEEAPGGGAAFVVELPL
ncbi:PAS domain-containing sensor histidine kinase [Myxococcus sp. RHSTA-1-4]|uniref:sensor histidine kinase n=1 Tax=Myxococcus sp. RHSTA-1-4 TaxID=2874601 RepID=UPI001CBC089F|nr:PAS domain-containing sensor histidine kinase [Myxococcus sp. RHSTA-1-4]MBZ4418382.1 PAS domain S-box protein [Myxococcus sp. RHSTA-1-4]